MADNYLEKKYEELRQGKPVVRRSSPSLDTLLKRVGETAAADPDYAVKQAQLDAVVRSASLSAGNLSFETRETSCGSQAFVRIFSPDGPFNLGQAVLAARLKAAELSLDSVVESVCPEEGVPSATVCLFRRLKA